jgi:hypothetical protein
VRLSHPLNSHLAHTAALWRKASEPIVEWLARSFERASGLAPVRAVLAPSVAPLSRAKSEAEPLMTGITPWLMPQLSAFIPTARGHRPTAVKDNPVPRACWDCGRALTADRRAFCGEECAESYRRAMGRRRPVVEPVARAPRKQHQTPAGRRAAERLPASEDDALRRWYRNELQPRLSRLHPTEVALGAAMGRSYANYIVAGSRIPHPRHYSSLAALVGVELPREFAAALSRPGGS